MHADRDDLVFDLADASVVTPQLWVGGSLHTWRGLGAEEQLAELTSAGLTHVLDVRKEWSDEDWLRERAAGVEYLHLGVDDAGQRMRDEWFDEGTAFVSDALVSGDAKVLVHCHMGINRGPSMGFACLLTQGWEPVAALTAIHRARDIAWMDYAEDATDWWARRTGLTDPQRLAHKERVALWRRRLGLDRSSIHRGLR